MPITASDIQFRLSGGASNTDGNASLGGAKSSTQVPGARNAFFDRVNSVESSSGDTEYRCLYVHNNHATLTLYAATVWISSNTPSTNTTIDIGVGTSSVNGTEQTVANENTAPTGVTFSAPSSYGTGLLLGDIPAGRHRAIWIRRTVTAGAAAYNNDGATIAVQGDTGA